MATAAQRRLPVERQSLAERRRAIRDALARVFQRRNVRRRRWRWRAQYILENKKSALHRRCPRRIRSHTQSRSLGENAAPRTVRGKFNQPNIITRHIGDAVM